MNILSITFILLAFISIFGYSSISKSANEPLQNQKIKTGASQTELYFPLLKDKRIGVMTNQTGLINNVHIIDSLLNYNLNVVRIFGPEHGFRGQAEAGEWVVDKVDKKTKIPVISLYGSSRKPEKQDLENIDILIFDIQDVGARFYTYISSLHYLMEAAAENNIKLIVLDRPNPNGFYVDGPILKPDFKSFIGMHPVPIVHGMTIGEYAKMINGEKWLANGIQCNLKVIPVLNYSREMKYIIPVPPSPNLQSQESIYLYPSLCLFEGTIMSLGRGTNMPFEIYGHPNYPKSDFSFTPISIPGVAKNPPHLNVKCYGKNVKKYADSILINRQLELKWLIDAYNKLGKPSDFFHIRMFDRLAGSDELRLQIINGLSEKEIRKTWQTDLQNFLKIREQYLLY